MSREEEEFVEDLVGIKSLLESGLDDEAYRAVENSKKKYERRLSRDE